MNEAQKRTWAEVDLTRLEHNYRILRSLTPKGCRFLGVVKANAYGHGAVPVARTLEALGADYLAVACLDEALELRRAGISAPILILGVTPPEYAGVLAAQRLTQTVGDWETARALSAALSKSGERLTVHIKADTGMSRLGFLADEGHLEEAAREIAGVGGLPGLHCEGIYTHFAHADGDEDYTMRQFTRFLRLVDRLGEEGVTFAIRHCAASAAVLHYPCTHLDMIRPGIALYGHAPGPGFDHTCCLLPVMSLKTRVAAVRNLGAGTAVSYGCTRVLDRDSRVAVLPVGYADGFFRGFSDALSVSIRGRSVPLLGRVCMDMCMVDVTDLPEAAVGDVAVLYGDEAPVEAGAALLHTISYELLCDISPRVPRLYRKV